MDKTRHRDSMKTSFIGVWMKPFFIQKVVERKSKKRSYSYENAIFLASTVKPQYNELLYNEVLSLTNVFICPSNVQKSRISEFNCKFINEAKKLSFCLISLQFQLIYCKIFSKI